MIGSRERDAVIHELRRWTIYRCPEHGITDEIHTRMDLRCPVVVKGVPCPHDLEGPIVVEEIVGG